MAFYSVLELRNFLARGAFPRIPESSSLMDDKENVQDYDQVMKTTLAIFYGIALETIHRSLPSVEGKAVDLACGPGQFTTLMAKYFDFESVTGIDLAQHMIECCKEKLSEGHAPKNLDYSIGDVTDLSRFKDDEIQLSTFMDAAHHLPTLDLVKKTLAEMDRVTSKDGLVFVLDVCRLRGAAVTEFFVDREGQPSLELGLTKFEGDFRASMYAAWTLDELGSCIPTSGKRRWLHLKPIGGAPVVQLIVGIPLAQKSLFLRKGFPWEEGDYPFLTRFLPQWMLLREVLRLRWY
jgi:SAM-dependent methyltransferase